MKEIIFATHNDHKVKEVNAILGENSFAIKSLTDIGYHDEIIEDGETMAENALIKARTIYRIKQVPVFSEDSGLEITALNMEPGIYTARYAGPDRDADQNMDKVLDKLKGKSDRSARFRACIAYIDEQGQEYVFEGIINGKIALDKRGADGFGYDPIFIPEHYDKTFAQLPDSVKNESSHRSRALAKLLNFLQSD